MGKYSRMGEIFADGGIDPEVGMISGDGENTVQTLYKGLKGQMLSLISG